MTRTEWMACGDSRTMFKNVACQMSRRKLFLAAIELTRIRFPDLSDLQNAALVPIERYVDGLMTLDELTEVTQAYWETHHPTNTHDSSNPFPDDEPPMKAECRVFPYWTQMIHLLNEDIEWLIESTGHLADNRALFAGLPARLVRTEWVTEHQRLTHLQPDVLRDIAGSAFHDVEFKFAWRTEDTLALARQMYETREFSAMPILADALQDAGCDNEDILNHCRDGAPHCRGCWAIDLILDKA